MLVEDSRSRLLMDYFHRMLYGVSKTISEYINLGDDYDKVRKVYSINIVYFDLGQGKDYVYHGRTEFRGLHDPGDVLRLSVRQQELFVGKVARTPLDEWVRFLKTGEIDATATAKGLPEARERLRVDALSVAEKRAYVRDMEALRYQRSVIRTGWDDGHREGRKEGLAEGRAEEAHDIAKRLLGMGLPVDAVAQATRLSAEEINCLKSE